MTIDRVLSLSRETNTEPVVVQQNDRNSRTVRLFPMEQSGQPFSMTGMDARILFRKNGATSPAYKAAVQPDGWVELDIPQEVTSCPGSGEMQLVLEQGERLLHSFIIPFTVKGSLSFVGETESPADDPMAVSWNNLPGKPATFPPSTHTHSLAQLGALGAGATAANAAKLGGHAPQYYLRPRNLLDNSCFARPVNTQGQAVYTGAVYGIDRWYGRASMQTLQVEKGCVRITATGQGYAGLKQKIENITDYAGKTVTFACRLYSNVRPEISIRNTGDEIVASTWGSALSEQTLCLTCQVPEDATPDSFVPAVLHRTVAPGDYALIYWAALYEGSYTADTLPPYESKEYPVELTACGRHFRRTRAESTYGTIGAGMAKTSTQAWIHVPRTRMRIGKPTVTITGSLRLYCGNTAVESAAIAVDKISDSYIRLSVTAEGLTPGYAVVATSGATTDFCIDENANL